MPLIGGGGAIFRDRTNKLTQCEEDCCGSGSQTRNCYFLWEYSIDCADGKATRPRVIDTRCEPATFLPSPIDRFELHDVVGTRCVFRGWNKGRAAGLAFECSSATDCDDVVPRPPTITTATSACPACPPCECALYENEGGPGNFCNEATDLVCCVGQRGYLITIMWNVIANSSGPGWLVEGTSDSVTKFLGIEDCGSGDVALTCGPFFFCIGTESIGGYIASSVSFSGAGAPATLQSITCGLHTYRLNYAPQGLVVDVEIRHDVAPCFCSESLGQCTESPGETEGI